MNEMAACVVNYNTRELLRTCLKSIQAIGPEEIVVVDNASSDASATMVKADFPNVRLIPNECNHGYGKAANQAIRNCRAEYVLLLNSDTVLSRGALASLGTYLHHNPSVAIVGPRLVNADGAWQPSCFPFPTPLDILLDVSHLGQMARLLPIARDAYLRTWTHTCARSVPWVSGAALAIRRQAFDIVGGFDESFFLYYEEVDLCFRLAKAGWQVHFAPITTVVHAGGASAIQQRSNSAVQLYSGLLHFYRRHYSGLRQVELILLIECIAFLRLVRDGIALWFANDVPRRASLSEDLTAWQQLLFGGWRDRMASG